MLKVQLHINNSKLQTHQVYVTTDSVRLANFESHFSSEQVNELQHH